jgi:hypothetical protein
MVCFSLGQLPTRQQRQCWFQLVTEVVGQMDVAGVRYALIGGFAMALSGIQRATVDLDGTLLATTFGSSRWRIGWRR